MVVRPLVTSIPGGILAATAAVVAAVAGASFAWMFVAIAVAGVAGLIVGGVLWSRAEERRHNADRDGT